MGNFMKDGYKHKTSLFGNAAENYVSRLFMLMKNPNGRRRPDLVSIDQRYEPILSVEVKSGAKRKGILVDYQLHYSITTTQAYRELFGEDPPKRTTKTELFGEQEITQSDRLLPGDPIAYYYAVLDRVDKLRAKDIDRPFSTIKCKWGDMFLAPADFAFYSFVACRVKRTDEDPAKVIPELKDMMKRDALSWKATNYDQRKGHIYSWQNIHGRDMLAIFQNDMSIATVKGRDRIRIIGDHYVGLSKLNRFLIQGPNGTKIYVLANPEDNNLFDVQLRKTVSERVPILERVARARKRAIPLLEKIVEPNSKSLFADDGADAGSVALETLNETEVKRLERLVNWLNVGEIKEGITPF